MKNLSIYKASAGSGKTFTLAVEYISILIINPSEYQNILAVTFTNKATGEMKQRILSQLYGISKGLKSSQSYVDNILKCVQEKKKLPQYQDKKQQEILNSITVDKIRTNAGIALSNIIHDYTRFRIETIDSFFQGIVKELANELDLSCNMKVEIDAKSVLSDSVDEIIETLKEGTPEFKSIISFINDKINSAKSWKIDNDVKKFGENIFKEKYLIHGEEVRAKITTPEIIEEYKSNIYKNVDSIEKNIYSTLESYYDKYIEAGYSEKNNTKDVYKLLEKAKNGDIKLPTDKSKGDFNEKVRKCAVSTDEFFKKKATNVDTLTPFLEHDLQPQLIKALQLLDEYVIQKHNVTAISKNLYHLMLINEISKKVRQLNNESNRFLLSETSNFLRNVINKENIPFIYEKTGTVIRHLMIDEFQDTSALQWNNFKPLILNSISIGGSCLIVGDVKQSIYRFRNSDWKILNEIERDSELQHYIKHIDADYNYRSSYNVIDFNNKLFNNAVNIINTKYKEVHNIDSDLVAAYKDVTQKCKKDEHEGYVRVENIDYHSINNDNISDEWTKTVSNDYNEATLERILLNTKELIDKNVSPNDITILVRVNKQIPQICEYFTKHRDILDVNVVSDDAFCLDASVAINIVIYALRSLAAQNDKIHIATLAYYYQTVVLQNEEIKETMSVAFLNREISELDNYLPNGFRQSNRINLKYKPLTEIIEEIYQAFELSKIEKQDAYLFYFYDVVQKYCEDNLTDIDSFLKKWDEKLHESTIPNGESNGVRIMTMHKSKGLEFHSVIIPKCSWSIDPKGTEVIWCEPKGELYGEMPLLPINVSQATKDTIFANDRNEEEIKTLVDNVNVIYVTFTRAENNLIILTGNKIDDALKDKENNTQIEIKDTQSFVINSLPKDMRTSDIEGVISVFEMGDIVPSKVADTNESSDNSDEVNILTVLPQPIDVSFNSYPSVADFRQSNESELFITSDSVNERVIQRNKRIKLISIGNLYHNIFQLINTVKDVPRAIRKLESQGCFDSLLDAKLTSDEVTHLIESVSVDHPEWFSDKWQVINERAILFQDENGVLLSKRPDRVVVNGNDAIIIDYKTAQDVVNVSDDGTLNAPEEHVSQLNTYKNLLSELGFSNIRAYLWYILDNIIVPV